MSDIDIEQMTKEEALEYMGLSSDANDFAIDEKFWQLSKKYRGKNDPESEEKLNELSAVYNIACGKRDEIKMKEEIRSHEKKFLGKTKDEWKTYISYTWFKALIIVVVVGVAISLIYNALFKDRFDCSVVAFGHFVVDAETLENRIVTDDLKTPYVSSVDIVVPNEQGQTENIYSDQTLATVLSMYPDVLITDEMTYKYYYGSFADISLVYDNIKLMLPQSVTRNIEPVYLSERDAFLFTKDYLLEQGLIEEDASANDYDTEYKMIGLKITDPAVIAELGFENVWPDSQPSLIFSVYSGVSDYTRTEAILTHLFQNMHFSE